MKNTNFSIADIHFSSLEKKQRNVKFSSHLIRIGHYMPLETTITGLWNFDDIYRTHYRRVYTLCRYLLRSPDAAEDAAQEVFLRVQRDLSAYDRALPFSSWLLSIASHYCIDVLRKRGVETRLFANEAAEDFEPAFSGPNPLAEILSEEQDKKIRTHLAALPDRFRVPLVLAYYNELRYDEIAATLGLKKAQVATLIFRAKQHLRRMLASEETKRGLSS